MLQKITLAFACIAVAACASMDRTLPARPINVADIIAPCTQDRRGSQTCGDALSNANVIAQVHFGQSQDEVRSIMGHDAERREVGQYTESWGYLTSYENQTMTWITFTDRTVTSLTHENVGRH